MSNRISGFTVVFKDSVHEEYMDSIKNAVLLFDGVATVSPIVEDASTFIGASQESHKIKMFLIDAVKNGFKK